MWIRARSGGFGSLLAVVTLLVSGCGSDSPASSASGTGGNSGKGQAMGGGTNAASSSNPYGGLANASGAANSTDPANRGGASSASAGSNSTAMSNRGGTGGAASSAGASSLGGTSSAAGSNLAGTPGQNVTAGATGVLPEVVIGGMSPMGITNDGTNLYWSTLGGSLDMRPLAGGTTVNLGKWNSNSGLMPLVYTKSGIFLRAGSKLYRCPTSGSCALIADEADGFVVDDDEIYWDKWNGEVSRMPLDGNSGEVVLSNPRLSTIGLHDNVLYYEANGDLYSFAVGTEPKKIGAIGNYVSSLVFDASSIYAILSSSTLIRIGYDGTGKQELMKFGNISGLVVNGGYLYFLAKAVAGCATTNINRYSPSTQAIETVLARFPCIMDYTFTADAIYFTYFGLSDSAIYRLPLK